MTDTESAQEGGLERTLGLWQVTASGVGIIVGAGIYVLVLRVDRGDAAPVADLLHVVGVPHVHYIGRWTVAQHGAVPAAAV